MAGIYFLAGRLGLSLALINSTTSAIWPPTGLALAGMLMLGYRIWPAVLAGAFLVNLTTSDSASLAGAIAVGNTLEAVLGTFLTTRFAGGRRTFDRAEDIVRQMALPPCPEILAEIAREVRAETPNVRRIGDLITRDVAAAAGILKTVNAAAYGLHGSARSVQQAIGYLGLDRTALLLAGLLLRKAFSQSDRPALARCSRSSSIVNSAACPSFM